MLCLRGQVTKMKTCDRTISKKSSKATYYPMNIEGYKPCGHNHGAKIVVHRFAFHEKDMGSLDIFVW